MRPDALLATGRRLWIGSLLWIIGRTLCRAARVDEAVRRELAPLPDGLTIRLEVNGMTRGLSLYKFAGRWPRPMLVWWAAWWRELPQAAWEPGPQWQGRLWPVVWMQLLVKWWPYSVWTGR